MLAMAIDRYFPAEVAVTRPEGSLFLWITLPEGCSGMELHQRTTAAGVAAVPGKPFFADNIENDRGLRMNFRCLRFRRLTKASPAWVRCCGIFTEITTKRSGSTMLPLWRYITMEEVQKKRILSGIQPSGDLTLGSYLGAIKNWAALAEEYDCYYMLADMHTITVRQTPADLRRRTDAAGGLYRLRTGPGKNVLFIQSHVPAHAQLGWVLDCYTMFGELSRMTQFRIRVPGTLTISMPDSLPILR